MKNELISLLKKQLKEVEDEYEKVCNKIETLNEKAFTLEKEEKYINMAIKTEKAKKK